MHYGMIRYSGLHPRMNAFKELQVGRNGQFSDFLRVHPSIRYSLPCIRGLTEHIMGCTPLRLAGLDIYFKILASILSQRHLIRLISTYLNRYYMGNVRLGQMDNSSNNFGLHPTMSHIMLTPLLSAKCRMHCLIMVSTVCK